MSEGRSGDNAVHGFCDPRFEIVRDAFEANFAERGELGAAVSARVDGRLVVDLYGGIADPEDGRAWQRDTLVNVYSVGKGILAILALILIERGEVDPDRPVAETWPEFGAEGKQAVTLRTLLSHRAGLPAVREALPEAAIYDWSRMCGALAAQRPYWEPDSAHGYHVNTFGFLVGEVLQRASGRSLSALLQQAVSGPLAVDFHFGLPRNLHGRVARMCVPDATQLEPASLEQALPSTNDGERDAMIRNTYFNPATLSGFGSVNTRAWRESVIPSTSGHADAHAVAAIYAALLSGGSQIRHWPSRSRLAEATRIHSDGEDRVLGRPSRFGLGFQLSQPSRPIGAPPRGFGHYGYGGSLGFADPEAAVAFGFLTNRPGRRWQTTRSRALVEALYACL